MFRLTPRILLVASALAILVCLLFSCHKEEQAASPPPAAPPVNKPVSQDVTPGLKLAKDLIAAGYTPLKAPKIDKSAKTQLVKVTDEYTNITFSNGRLSIDSQGRVLSFWVFVLDQPSSNPKLTPFRLQTYAGSDLTTLSKDEILKLYGNPNSFNNTKSWKEKTLHYEYRLGKDAVVHVTMLFKGTKSSSKLGSITANCDSGELASQILEMNKGLDYFLWPS